MIIFPVATNISLGSSAADSVKAVFGGSEKLEPSDSEQIITLRANIPCSGHASLITGELKTIYGVGNIKFRSPNLFDVSYNPEKTSKEQMLSLDIFNTYKATVIVEEITTKII